MQERQPLDRRQPSLEKLIETIDLGLEVLHPGGLEITRELAMLCHIGRQAKVLDVASGTGESACFLQAKFGAQVTGVDISERMLKRARKTAAERNLQIEFKQGDAHNLPFEENHFDAAISECTVCLLEKGRAIREMVRIVKPGGYVGLHDVCWKDNTPERFKQRLDPGLLLAVIHSKPCAELPICPAHVAGFCLARHRLRPAGAPNHTCFAVGTELSQV